MFHRSIIYSNLFSLYSNGTSLQDITLCNIDLARYYPPEQVYDDTSADISTSFAKLGNVNSIELIGNGLSLTQLTHLFNGVSNLAHIDISNNNIPCEECSKVKQCDCDVVEKMSALISKVQNSNLSHNFIYEREKDKFSYNETINNLNTTICSNKKLLNKLIFLGKHK